MTQQFVSEKHLSHRCFVMGLRIEPFETNTGGTLYDNQNAVATYHFRAGGGIECHWLVKRLRRAVQ